MYFSSVRMHTTLEKKIVDAHLVIGDASKCSDHELSSHRTHRGWWTWNRVMCDFQIRSFCSMLVYHITLHYAQRKGNLRRCPVDNHSIKHRNAPRRDGNVHECQHSSIEWILAHFCRTHAVPAPKQSRGHAPKKLREVELKVSVWLLYYSLLMTISRPAHVQCCQQCAGHLPQWTSDGAAGDVWSQRKHINYMESLETSRIYNEEGMWAHLLIIFCIY